MKKRNIVSIIIIAIIIFTSVIPEVTYAASGTKYWLKVNTQANVVNVYKKTDGKWKPYKVMLCSTGINGTPLGTYYIKNRWDWGALFGGTYGRYCVHIFGDYLFHSVPYDKKYDKKSMPTKEFNKLGKDASKGCVRLSVNDAKWVYNNCKKGTKVTIYKSSDPGPLGKPEGIKVNTTRKKYWDPTDNDPNNPYYLLKKPLITVSSKKNLNIKYGSSYNLKNGVTAKDPNTLQNLTGLVNVSKVKKYSNSKGKYVESKFSTKSCGLYKITYRVKHAYSGTSYKTIKIKVGYKLNAPKVKSKNRASDGKPQLTWSSVKNADKYVIYRATSQNGTYSKIYTQKDTTYTNTAKTEPGKKYYYKVKAVSNKNNYIDSDFSNTVSRVCDLSRPNISFETKENATETVISWLPVENASEYVIEMKVGEEGTFVEVARIEGSCFEYLDVLEQGRSCCFRIKAILGSDSNADSAYSNELTVLSDDIPETDIVE